MPLFHPSFKSKCSCDFSWLFLCNLFKISYLKNKWSVWKMSTLSPQVLSSAFLLFLLGNQQLHLPLIFHYIYMWNLSIRCFKGNPEYFRAIQSKYIMVYASRNYFHHSFIHSASENWLKQFLLSFFNSHSFCCINLWWDFSRKLMHQILWLLKVASNDYLNKTEVEQSWGSFYLIDISLYW